MLESYKGKGPLIEAIADADAAIVRSDIIDAEVLEAAKKLKLVVRAGAGYDNIDTATAKAKGIAVMNTPGQNANAVAELVFGMMVYLARGKFNGKTGGELRGKTIGLHAFGMVGRAVAAIAKGFSMTVSRSIPFVKPEVIEGSRRRARCRLEDLYRRLEVRLAAHPRHGRDQGLDRQEAAVAVAGGRHLDQHRAQRGHQRGRAARGARDQEGLPLRLRHRAERRHGRRDQGEVSTRASTSRPVKMGAQTEEANVNAGLAAARQIIGFFERGDRTFVVNN